MPVDNISAEERGLREHLLTLYSEKLLAFNAKQWDKVEWLDFEIREMWTEIHDWFFFKHPRGIEWRKKHFGRRWYWS